MSTLLLIDDHPDPPQALSAILSDGFVVHAVVSVVDAISLISGQQPEVILVHVPLLTSNITDVQNRIRAIPALRTVPLVAIVDVLDDQVLNEMLRAPVDAFVHRSLHPTLMLLRIMEIIEGAQARREYLQDSDVDSLLAQLPDGILILDRSSTILKANAQMVAMLGLNSANELIGVTLGSIMHGLVGGDDHLHEIEMRQANGDIIRVEAASAPISLALGGNLDMMVFRDVTERRHVEEMLARQKMELEIIEGVARQMAESMDLLQRLQVLADAIVDILPEAEAASVWLRDPDTNILVLKAWRTHNDEDMQSLSEVTNQALVRVVVDERRIVNIADTSADPHFTRFEKPALDRIRSVLALPLFTQGEAVGVLCADCFSRTEAFDGDDIRILEVLSHHAEVAIRNAKLYQQLQSQAKELEYRVAERTAELARERDLHRAILEALDNGVIVTDINGDVQYSNAALLGLLPEHAPPPVGQKWSPFDDEIGISAEVGSGRATVHPEGGRRIEVRKNGSNGKLMDILFTELPLAPNSSATVEGAVYVFSDITELKEAERLKDRFVSNVSHELRSPLSVLVLHAANLEKHYAILEDSTRQRMVSKIAKQADILKELLNDVLEMSRIDSGKVSLIRRRLDLNKTLAAEARRLKPLARERGHKLMVITLDTVRVHCNEDQLRVVIRNLLDNAIKYTPRGGEIMLETARIPGGIPEMGWPDSANLSAGLWGGARIADNGIGIPASEIALIFERFHRVTSPDKPDGTGLGLSIARDLIELHGGRISVKSEQGKGSTFAIYLPLQED